jgi:ketosteroid isomerase-like protein
MSQENVEIVRRWVAAFNHPDDVKGFVELWGSDCEFFTLFATRLADAPYKGHDGLRSYLTERAQAWAELRIQADDMHEVEGRIVVIGRIRGRGRRSSLETEQPIGLVFELRNRQVFRVRSYSDTAEALEAAGLSD